MKKFSSFEEKQRTLHGRKRALVARETYAEKLFRERLEASGIRHIAQKAFIQGNGYYFVDFYLPKPIRACIEIDGGYHREPNQVASDLRKDAYLRGRGFRVIRIKNEDVMTASLSFESR